MLCTDVSCALSFSLFILIALFPDGPGLAGNRNIPILDFLGAKDD